MTTDQKRHPKGTPASKGGKFAPQQHAESGVSLDSASTPLVARVDWEETPSGKASRATKDGFNLVVLPESGYWEASTADGLHTITGQGASAEDARQQAIDAIAMLKLDERARSEEERYGRISVREGSTTPWGRAQHVENLAPGVAFASTAGHGGYKLSQQRNKQVHPAWRRRGGWYEEDCERYIVEHTFRNEEWVEISDEDAEQGARRFFPEEFDLASNRR